MQRPGIFIVTLVVLLMQCSFASAQPKASATNVCPRTNAQQTLEDLERECLKQLSSLASRSGNDLILKLENGRSVTLKSNPAACEAIPVDFAACLIRRLVGYYPYARTFVVEEA